MVRTRVDEIKDLFKELDRLNLTKSEEKFVNNLRAFYGQRKYLTPRQVSALIKIKVRRKVG